MDLQQEYIVEVKEILKNLEQSLMQLQESPNNPDEINNVYRYLHTLKGSASLFGYDDVEKLSHEMEYLYSDIRDGIIDQDDFILDLTLHSVDVFNDLIDGKNADSDIEKIVADIKTLCNNNVQGDKSDSNDPKKPQTSGTFVVLLQPGENIFKRGINIQAILEEVEELGNTEVIIHNENTPLEKQLEQKKLESFFEILIAADCELSDVQDVFMFLKGHEYEIIPITSKADFSIPPYSGVVKLDESGIEQRVSKFTSWVPELFQQQAPKEKKEATEIVAQLEEIKAEEDQEDTIEIVSGKKRKNGHVNVSTEKLDYLINIVSEMVTFRSELQHLMQDQKNNKLDEAIEKLERLTLKLRDSAFNIRLVPLNIIKVKLQRLIRTISKDLGKEVEFITDGLDTELDRGMINAIEAPLMHIIRNAIDHGLETPEERLENNKEKKGLLKFSSFNSGDHVFIQIQDDGKGVDFEKIKQKGIEKGILNKNQDYTEKELLNIIFSPGFSTAENISKISGRGVGMDVVKKEISSLRGEVEIETEKGLGSIFTIRLPLTLTVLDTLVVNVSEQKYLIPISEVEYCYEAEHASLFEKKSRQIQYNGQLTPFVSLREFFGKDDFPKNETVVVINKNDTKVAVVVDGIIGKLQTVYKPLNELLKSVDCFSGASILGDGSTALILNALKLQN